MNLHMSHLSHFFHCPWPLTSNLFQTKSYSFFESQLKIITSRKSVLTGVKVWSPPCDLFITALISCSYILYTMLMLCVLHVYFPLSLPKFVFLKNLFWQFVLNSPFRVNLCPHFSGNAADFWGSKRSAMQHCSVMPKSVWHHRLCPPGSSVHGILQARILERVSISFSNAWKWKSESEVAQSFPTLRDPMDCSLPGSSVHGIFQARVPEWVPLPSPNKGSNSPQILIPSITGSSSAFSSSHLLCPNPFVTV